MIFLLGDGHRRWIELEICYAWVMCTCSMSMCRSKDFTKERALAVEGAMKRKKNSDSLLQTIAPFIHNVL